MSLSGSEEIPNTTLITSSLIGKRQVPHEIEELDQKTSLKTTQDLLMHSTPHQKTISDHKLLEMKSNLPEQSEKLINGDNDMRKSDNNSNGSMDNNSQVHSNSNYPQNAYFQH